MLGCAVVIHDPDAARIGLQTACLDTLTPLFVYTQHQIN